ncbi:hypothetical protein MSG28_002030, partial [Choristoneura fumiferana]
IVEEQQCQDFGFRLTCRDLDAHIAILEAWYTSTENSNASQPLVRELKLKTENDSELDHTVSIHYCNREVALGVAGAASEGYIRTPGYPHYYIGDECRWRLRAHPEQRIRVTLLDVSLRSIGPFENACTDYVLVQDANGDSLLSSCEQVELPLRLSSVTETVEVVVEARSAGAFPKRGVLFHYKSCVTLPAPSDGYLVYRNEDVAHYMCNVHHVFVDTRQRARVIWCYDDNRWNDSVPLCVEEGGTNPTSEDSDTNMPHNDANMIV